MPLFTLHKKLFLLVLTLFLLFSSYQMTFADINGGGGGYCQAVTYNDQKNIFCSDPTLNALMNQDSPSIYSQTINACIPAACGSYSLAQINIDGLAFEKGANIPQYLTNRLAPDLNCNKVAGSMCDSANYDSMAIFLGSCGSTRSYQDYLNLCVPIFAGTNYANIKYQGCRIGTAYNDCGSGYQCVAGSPNQCKAASGGTPTPTPTIHPTPTVLALPTCTATTTASVINTNCSVYTAKTSIYTKSVTTFPLQVNNSQPVTQVPLSQSSALTLEATVSTTSSPMTSAYGYVYNGGDIFGLSIAKVTASGSLDLSKNNITSAQLQANRIAGKNTETVINQHNDYGVFDEVACGEIWEPNYKANTTFSTLHCTLPTQAGYYSASINSFNFYQNTTGIRNCPAQYCGSLGEFYFYVGASVPIIPTETPAPRIPTPTTAAASTAQVGTVQLTDTQSKPLTDSSVVFANSSGAIIAVEATNTQGVVPIPSTGGSGTVEIKQIQTSSGIVQGQGIVTNPTQGYSLQVNPTTGTIVEAFSYTNDFSPFIIPGAILSFVLLILANLQKKKLDSLLAFRADDNPFA